MRPAPVGPALQSERAASYRSSGLVRGLSAMCLAAALTAFVHFGGCSTENPLQGGNIISNVTAPPDVPPNDIVNSQPQLSSEAEIAEYQQELAANGLPAAPIPNFPGAEGFGSHAFGGRGNGPAPRIIRVTTLQDRLWNGSQWVAAPGSLRAAVEATGPRFVVFDVSGAITLSADMDIKNPYITIAGQSAPAGGVTLAHHGIRLRTHDIVLRHLRLRMYFDDVTDWMIGRFMDGMIFYKNDFELEPPADPYLDSVYNVVIDHCSIAWAIDETINITNWVRTLCIQWCIISEGSKYGSEIGLEGWGWLTDSDPTSDDHPARTTKCSVHHNLFTHNVGRNPLITTGHTWDFRNNVIYNWVNSQPSQFRSEANVNFVGNNYLAGLDTSITPGIRFLINVADPLTDPAKPGFFIQGNFGPLRTQPTQNEWDIGVAYYRYNSGSQCAQPPGTYCVFYVDQTGEKPGYELNEPAPAPHVTTQESNAARDLVLQSVGATRPARDTVDTRLVNEVSYVASTRPFERTDPGYNPAADPQLRHYGPNSGNLRSVLLFKPQNDPGYGCLPRVYLIDPGQTVDAAKLEMLNRMFCIFPDGIQLPFDAADVLADTTTYQWEVTQVIVPDAALIQSLYPNVSNPALPADSDNDGVPDSFELVIGSNPSGVDSLQDADGDGYLNIEEYLNSLAG